MAPTSGPRSNRAVASFVVHRKTRLGPNWRNASNMFRRLVVLVRSVLYVAFIAAVVISRLFIARSLVVIVMGLVIQCIAILNLAINSLHGTSILIIFCIPSRVL